MLLGASYGMSIDFELGVKGDTRPSVKTTFVFSSPSRSFGSFTMNRKKNEKKTPIELHVANDSHGSKPYVTLNSTPILNISPKMMPRPTIATPFPMWD